MVRPLLDTRTGDRGLTEGRIQAASQRTMNAQLSTLLLVVLVALVVLGQVLWVVLITTFGVTAVAVLLCRAIWMTRAQRVQRDGYDVESHV